MARNDIASNTSGLVSRATYIMAIINDGYLILSKDGPVETLLKRWDDDGDEAVGKLSGRKSAMIKWSIHSGMHRAL